MCCYNHLSGNHIIKHTKPLPWHIILPWQPLVGEDLEGSLNKSKGWNGRLLSISKLLFFFLLIPFVVHDYT